MNRHVWTTCICKHLFQAKVLIQDLAPLRKAATDSPGSTSRHMVQPAGSATVCANVQPFARKQMSDPTLENGFQWLAKAWWHTVRWTNIGETGQTTHKPLFHMCLENRLQTSMFVQDSSWEHVPQPKPVQWSPRRLWFQCFDSHNRRSKNDSSGSRKDSIHSHFLSNFVYTIYYVHVNICVYSIYLITMYTSMYASMCLSM